MGAKLKRLAKILLAASVSLLGLGVLVVLATAAGDAETRLRTAITVFASLGLPAGRQIDDQQKIGIVIGLSSVRLAAQSLVASALAAVLAWLLAPPATTVEGESSA